MEAGWISSQWQALLEAHGLADFESGWDKPLHRVDEPNRKNGGWSEVCRYPLDEPGAPAKTLYIKRQENYTSRTWQSFLKACPTFEKEYKNLVWCGQHDIPVAEPVAFMKSNSPTRAILITAGLDDYTALSELECQENFTGETRKQVIASTAGLIAHMHGQGLRHGCLYSKHIYISQSFLDEGVGDIRLIDLEKARPLLFGKFGIFRDLDSLNRHALGWSREERTVFLKQYLGVDTGQFNRLYHRLHASYREWINASA